MPKKNRKYTEMPPTIDAISRIGLAEQAHKEDLLSGLLYVLWESHAEEVADAHGGDDWCSTCDLMREAARILKLDHPSLATDCTVPKANPYTNDGDEGEDDL